MKDDKKRRKDEKEKIQGKVSFLQKSLLMMMILTMMMLLLVWLCKVLKKYISFVLYW